MDDVKRAAISLLFGKLWSWRNHTLHRNIAHTRSIVYIETRKFKQLLAPARPFACLCFCGDRIYPYIAISSEYTKYTPTNTRKSNRPLRPYRPKTLHAQGILREGCAFLMFTCGSYRLYRLLRVFPTWAETARKAPADDDVLRAERARRLQLEVAIIKSRNRQMDVWIFVVNLGP